MMASASIAAQMASTATRSAKSVYHVAQAVQHAPPMASVSLASPIGLRIRRENAFQQEVKFAMNVSFSYFNVCYAVVSFGVDDYRVASARLPCERDDMGRAKEVEISSRELFCTPTVPPLAADSFRG